MKAGYRFQIGWARAREDERRVRIPWAFILCVLGVIAVIMLWLAPLKAAPAARVQPAPSHSQPAPAPTVAAIQINGNSPVCVLPTGNAKPRTVELVKVP